MTDMTETAPRAGRREWIGLVVLSIACLIYSMDLSVLFLAIPAIVADLKPSAAEVLWINDIYGFMVAGFLVTMGTLGDRIGRRKILLIGAAAFGIASVLVAFSPNTQLMIIARALQGIAGATIAPSTLSLIVNMFRDENERNRAIGIWGTAFSIGGLIGPVIGGVLLQYFHWGSVFLINVPIMLALLTAAPFLLPEYKSGEAGRIDLTSVALSLATVLPVIYGLKEIAAYGMSAASLAAIVAGVGLGYVFIRRQKSLEHPLIDLALFKVAAFNASLMVNLAGVFFVFGIFFFQNQYLQLVLGLTPLEAGLWSLAPSLVFTYMSLNAWKVTEKFGPTRSVIWGLVIFAAGTAAMGLASWLHSLYGILAASAIIALGFVPVILTTTGLIVGSVPPERAGSASAMSETSAEFGGALGVALLGSMATFIYRAMMAAVPLPADVAQAGKSTLGGAVEAAKKLAAGTDLGWLETARHAFATGFAATCALAAIAMLLMAWIAARVYAVSDVKVAGH